MRVSLIAAVSENDVIGCKGKIPWDLPADLQYFRHMTGDYPVIMGRRTYESIRRPLPGRQNIVITHRLDFHPLGCDVVHSLEEALECARKRCPEEVFVIGGEEIYRAALPLADRIYLTRVHAEVEGDAMFPSLSDAEWHVVSSDRHGADEKHAYPFTFFIYERRKRSTE